MAGNKSTKKDKKRTTENGSINQQDQYQLQNQVQTTEPNNESLASAMIRPSEQEPTHNEDLERFINNYIGGDMGYLAEWLEQVNEDLEKIRCYLDVLQNCLRGNDDSA